MALFNCHFMSKTMEALVSFTVVLPHDVKKDTPWILLLHGLHGDETDWERHSSVERYANEKGFGLVMPYGADSFYTDEVSGRPYYSYITKELIPYVQTVFPLSKKREKMFVAGLSMGGYGALKIGLRNPNKFGAIAELSGVADIYERFTTAPNLTPDMKVHAKRCWGQNYLDVLKPKKGNKENILCLLEDFNYDKGYTPWIYQACGTEDLLYEPNERLNTILDKYPIHHEWHKKPGIHDWYIWDYYIKDAIRFFDDYMKANN